MRFDRTGEWLDQIAPRSRATRVMTTCVSKSRSAASLAALAFGPGFFPIITQLLLRHALFLSSFPSPQGLSRKRITIQGPPFRTVRSMGGSESDGRPKSAAPVQRSLRWTRPCVRIAYRKRPANAAVIAPRGCAAVSDSVAHSMGRRRMGPFTS